MFVPRVIITRLEQLEHKLERAPLEILKKKTIRHLSTPLYSEIRGIDGSNPGANLSGSI